MRILAIVVLPHLKAGILVNSMSDIIFTRSPWGPQKMIFSVVAGESELNPRGDPGQRLFPQFSDAVYPRGELLLVVERRGHEPLAHEVGSS